MDPKTGEIRLFDPEEGPPKDWVMVPPKGTKIEIRFKQRVKGGVTSTRKRWARVVEVREGNPGQLVVEMLPIKE